MRCTVNRASNALRRDLDMTDVENKKLLARGTTPPNNIGPRSTPNYRSLADKAIVTKGGLTVFAGQRDDAGGEQPPRRQLDEQAEHRPDSGKAGQPPPEQECRAKEQGRNNYQLCTPSMTQVAADALGITYQEAENIKIGMPAEVVQNLLPDARTVGLDTFKRLDIAWHAGNYVIGSTLGATASITPPVLMM